MYALRGFGQLTYYDLLAQANLQQCDPRDSACVASNVAKQAAVEDYWVAHMTSGVPAGTQLSFAPLTQAQVQSFASPGSPTVGNIVPTGIMSVDGQRFTADVPGGGSSAPASYSPHVSFSSSRGGTSLEPGDTWHVSITGGPPNSPVTVSGSMPSGSFSNSPMGKTDANGNFSLAGTITADQVGNWSESWSVGSLSAGAFSFTVRVNAPPAGSAPGGAASGAPTEGAGKPGANAPPAAPGFWDIPNIRELLVAGGAAAVLFFAFGRNR
jgi:hypothetical protein